MKFKNGNYLKLKKFFFFVNPKIFWVGLLFSIVSKIKKYKKYFSENTVTNGALTYPFITISFYSGLFVLRIMNWLNYTRIQSSKSNPIQK
jgi:hypothetical protein